MTTNNDQQLGLDLQPDSDTNIDPTVQDVLEQRRAHLEEKQAYREDRYAELADKHRKASNACYSAAKQIGDMIPMGQPILVGHHSERRHRKDIERIDNNMRASIEHDKTADYYEGKLASMRSNRAISSDDPDALEKLKAKLNDLEESQEFMKRCNAAVRKVVKLDIELDQKIDKLVELAEIKRALAAELLTPKYGRITGFEQFELGNNNANIRRIRERIKEMETQLATIAEQGESADRAYPELELELVENHVLNRVQLVFEGKPPEEVRAVLKDNGFRWSPREGAWQRQLNNNGRSAAQRVINHLLMKQNQS